jgi:RNA recognition motif-containing protein
VCLQSEEMAEKAMEAFNLVNFIPRGSQTGIVKPISISILDPANLKEKFKQDLDKNLLIKNIPKSMSGRDFYTLVRSYGKIKLCKLNTDFFGNSKGYGYVYYMNSTSADEATKNLTTREINGKKLIVCNLIPGKTKENQRNNIYVKNLPLKYTSDDLRNLFKTYGEIKSAVITRNDNGHSKGFGFVCFNNPAHANMAYRTLKSKKIFLEGQQNPLYLNYAEKKDERAEKLMKETKIKNLKIFARLREDLYLIKTEEDFRTEIKNIFKIFLYDENYSARNISIKMDTRTALITMNSQKDVDVLLERYVEFCDYYLPKVFLNYYQNKHERSLTYQYVNQINSMIDPMNMFSNFKNLSVVDPNEKPILNLIPDENNKKNIYSKNQNFNNKKFKGYQSYNPKRNSYKNNHKKTQKGYLEEYIIEPKPNVIPVETNLIKKEETSLYEVESIDDAASQIYEIAEKIYKE